MHRSWRERIGGHAGDSPEPVFEPSDDPALAAFGRLLADSRLVSFDANKRRDSTHLGSTLTVAMPQDERTAALLLLVTSSFVHLAARREAGTPLVQGAIDAGDGDYRFVELLRTALPTTGRSRICTEGATQ